MDIRTSLSRQRIGLNILKRVQTHAVVCHCHDISGDFSDQISIMSIGWCDIDLITDWHIQHDFEEGDWKPWEAFRNLPQGYIGLLDPLHSPNRGAMDDVTSIGAIVLSDRAIDRITTHTRAQPEAEIKITGQLSEADLVAVTNINLSH